MYDLNLMPIKVEKGKQQAGLTGFQAAGPPRKVTRSRAEDMLILFLTTSEQERLSEDLKQTWLDQLTDMFFKTSGSVTSALRSLIEKMNLTLMERNFNGSPKSGMINGGITAAALHNNYIYIAQSGLTHAYVLTDQGLTHFYDSSLSDRGLGMSRTPAVRYFQADIGSGGYLFMTDTPPSTWRDDLLCSEDFPNPEQLKRRLLNQIPASFQLGLVQMKPGGGDIVITQSGFPQTSPEETAEAKEPVEAGKPQTDSDRQMEPKPEAELEKTQQIGLSLPGIKEADRESAVEPTQDEKLPIEKSETMSTAVSGDKVRKEPKPGKQSQAAHLYRMQTIQTPEVKKHRLSKSQKNQVYEKSLKGIAAFFEKWRKTRQHIDTFFKDLIARWSPNEQEAPPQLSRRTQLIIALIVPLVVVAIATGVYIGRGRTLQYESYFGLAQAKAASAINASDANQARTDWREALDLIAEAETYKQTNEAVVLKEQAQEALDALDGAIRLRYHSALIGSLPETVNITRIISYGSDLYMLDSNGGRVIHALGTGQGYQVNDDLICEGGNYSGGNIGALVDMVSLPPNNPYQAHILGLDSSGSAVYCAPGLDPVVQTLPMAAGVQVGLVKAAYESNTLYVLDTNANTIFVYVTTNGQFIDTPVDYFESSEPAEKPDISFVTDLEVNGAKLYLLQSSGLIVECVYSGLEGDPVSCQNPVTYIDGRSGREEQAVSMPQSNFTAILYNPPPVSTVSILDANNADIYRFSQIFRLNRQLRPEMGDAEVISPSATAFTIGMERVIFMAFGNQVFFAYIE